MCGSLLFPWKSLAIPDYDEREVFGFAALIPLLHSLFVTGILIFGLLEAQQPFPSAEKPNLPNMPKCKVEYRGLNHYSYYLGS